MYNCNSKVDMPYFVKHYDEIFPCLDLQPLLLLSIEEESIIRHCYWSLSSLPIKLFLLKCMYQARQVSGHVYV